VTRGLRAAAALLAALALTACDPADRTPRVVTETRFLERLGGAIGDVNAARARLATDASAIGTAAAKIDDVDDVAVDGNRDAVRNRRGAAANALRPASVAARRYNKDVRGYEAAITALAAADGEGLRADQRAAVDGVVTSARAEARELHRYAAMVASVWPRYELLESNQRVWFARSSNGWYRDQHEAAGAYVVLSDRAGLAPARRSLAAADGRRLAAARACDAAIAAARGALASLLG
jgi:hypothetical protein